MDFGTDLRLIDDDIILTADGDVELVSGPAMVAQDIDQTLKTTPGALYGDSTLGSTLMYLLNDTNADAASVIAEMERVAIDDARVNPDSVKAYQKGEHKFVLEFTPLAAINPEILEFDLTKEGA
jgi:hypothetical protein